MWATRFKFETKMIVYLNILPYKTYDRYVKQTTYVNDQ